MLFRHGHATDDGRTAEYEAWHSMIQRCTNPKNPGWKNYGGRGIKVCSRWLDFVNFLADVGRKPSPKHSLDRFPNNDGNYEPGNVRWATKSQQQSNQRLRTPCRTNKKGKYPKGVKKVKGKFTARVVLFRTHGKTKHLGTFNTINEAAEAVRRAECEKSA